MSSTSGTRQKPTPGFAARLVAHTPSNLSLLSAPWKNNKEHLYCQAYFEGYFARGHSVRDSKTNSTNSGDALETQRPWTSEEKGNLENEKASKRISVLIVQHGPCCRYNFFQFVCGAKQTNSLNEETEQSQRSLQEDFAYIQAPTMLETQPQNLRGNIYRHSRAGLYIKAKDSDQEAFTKRVTIEQENRGQLNSRKMGLPPDLLRKFQSRSTYTKIS